MLPTLDEYIGVRVKVVRSLSIRFGFALIIYLSLRVVLPNINPTEGMRSLYVIAILIEFLAGVCVGLSGWLVFYKGSELLSLMIEGEEKYRFQLKIALITPLALSLYFIKDVEEFHLGELFASYGWWSIFPFAFLYWLGSKVVDPDDAIFVKMCLGFSIVLFFICWKSHLGYFTEYEDEVGYDVLDTEAAKRYSQTGQYMMHYLGLVISSYLGMFSIIWKEELAYRSAKFTTGQP